MALSVIANPDASRTESLLELLHRRGGHELRDLAPAYARRRLAEAARLEGDGSLEELAARAERDELCRLRLVRALSRSPGRFFGSPEFFAAFRRSAIPWLKTYPSIRIWQLGGSTGEDAYSLAVVLHEEGLLARSRVYASELPGSGVLEAASGTFPLAALEQAEHRHAASGGAGPLSRHWTREDGLARLLPALRERVVFLEHSSVTDGSINEFHAVVCRGALLRWNRAIQQRLHRLISESLCPFGLLSPGADEASRAALAALGYAELESSAALYRRVR